MESNIVSFKETNKEHVLKRLHELIEVIEEEEYSGKRHMLMFIQDKGEGQLRFMFTRDGFSHLEVLALLAIAQNKELNDLEDL